MNFITTTASQMKGWLPRAATEITTPHIEGHAGHGFMAIIDTALRVRSWLPGVATDTAIGEVNKDQEPLVPVQPRFFSKGSKRPTISRGAIRKPGSRVLRIKIRSSAHKWAKQPEFLLKFRKAAADIGGAPVELIAWALGSYTEAKDLEMAFTPEAAHFSTEAATIESYTIRTLMKQIYQDIHVSSAPGLINSTSDLAYFFGREPSVSTQMENRIQFNVALQTQAMFRVIEYAVAGRESVRDCFSTTVHAAVYQLRVQPDSIGRISDVIANEVQLSKRYASFAAEHGWMMLSMLANSVAFRNAAQFLEDSIWASFNVSICQNKNSIEYFAKTRGLNWTLALTRQPEYPSLMVDLREGYPGIQPDHPHNHIVPQNSKPIQQPQYNGKIQKNITSNRFRASDFRSYGRSKKPPRDPTIQRGLLCEICGSRSCRCEPSSCEGVLRPLVELVQSGNNIGVGIRVLQPIRKDQLLAEYVGDIVPEDCHVDDTYSMSFTPHDGTPSTAIITAQENGNWTRFVNHSCDAHAVFVNKVIGKKHRIMLMSIRDIEMFEELTVDYGNIYWATRPTLCKCGSRNCRFVTVEKRDETAVSCGVRPVSS